jgi:hypothetical protein
MAPLPDHPLPGPLGRAILPWAILLALVALSGCSSPSRYEDGLIGAQAPVGNRRRILLTFERESDFSALAHREVLVSVREPATLASPAGGRGLTDQSGQIELLVDPVAVYDRDALKSGDIIVDYPAELTVSMAIGGTVYEWDLDGHDSFARYADPLYRGLDRDPDPATLSLTLTVP